MKRFDNIEKLHAVQGNIEFVEKQLNYKKDRAFMIFGTDAEWEHKQEIRTKALAYWKRRFNRILTELK